MNKLLPSLMLCAFALVQVPAHAQAAKSATAAAPAASRRVGRQGRREEGREGARQEGKEGRLLSSSGRDRC